MLGGEIVKLDVIEKRIGSLPMSSMKLTMTELIKYECATENTTIKELIQMCDEFNELLYMKYSGKRLEENYGGNRVEL